MYMDTCFARIAAVLTNHSDRRIESYKYKILLCVMHGIHVFDRNVWFEKWFFILSRSG